MYLISSEGNNFLGEAAYVAAYQYGAQPLVKVGGQLPAAPQRFLGYGA